MGIFDDAIRQHLDLKRRQGVDESELKELEDEAFGAPARPGEPEFPGDDGHQAGDDVAGVAESVAEEAGTQTEPAPAPEPEESAPESEEPASDTDPGLAQADAGEESGGEPEAGFTTAEREAIADQPTEFFEQAPEGFDLGEVDLDLDQELDEDEDFEDEPADVGEEATPSGELAALEDEELEDETPEPSQPAGEELEEEELEEDGLEEESEPEGDDVLEETPEFLKERPEDDELWFEQGKPKDFDF